MTEITARLSASSPASIIFCVTSTLTSVPTSFTEYPGFNAPGGDDVTAAIQKTIDQLTGGGSLHEKPSSPTPGARHPMTRRRRCPSGPTTRPTASVVVEEDATPEDVA